MKPISLLYQGGLDAQIRADLEHLVDSGLVHDVLLLVPPGTEGLPEVLGGQPVRSWRTPFPGSSRTVRELLDGLRTPYLLQIDPGGGLRLVQHALERLLGVAHSTGAVLAYGDYWDLNGSSQRLHPLADYQEGSLQDTFPFGPLMLWSVRRLRSAMRRLGPPPEGLRWNAWYDLRLKGAAEAPVFHLPEPLATRRRVDQRKSGAAVFDYLLAQREVQREAEEVVTEHLRRTGAHLSGPFVPFVSRAPFPAEASVVIPVRDRVQTVGQAVDSALSQQAPFAFNVLVVDNHSTDGTAELLAAKAAADPRLHHIVPESRDLGIGGCWNEAIFHPAAGRYVVQLDSDDLYKDDSVLARIVQTLQEGQCGLVVGSYELVDFDLNPIPPGLIDHREWTDANGPNNALRVNGLGAPRAFATELVRQEPFPNVSYGEDYAVALSLSRQYRVGRIYRSLYLCRRWEDNTDADLDPVKVAAHQHYKDRLRTLELAARRTLNQGDEGAA